MKLTASFLVALASGDICGDCNENIAEFNAWHAQSNIICSRYTHPRDYAEFADPRAAACKDCKVQCVPNNDTCPGTDQLKAGFWNKTALKLKEQYVNRAEDWKAAKAAEAAARNLEKEKAKYDKIVNKLAEKKEKTENKEWKKEDYSSWRENRRQENEAKRALKKQQKKDAKAAAKAAKELRKQQRLEKRALAEKNKVLFAFYAELEEHYEPLCPDMFLIQDNDNLARKFSIWKKQLQ